MIYFYYKYQWILNKVKELFKGNRYTRKYNRDFDSDIKNIHSFFQSIKENINKNNKNIFFGSYVPLPYVIKIEGLFSEVLNALGYNTFSVYNFYSKISHKYHNKIFNNKTFLIDRFISFKNYYKIVKLVNLVIKKNYEEIKNFNYGGCLSGIHALAKISASTISGKIVLDNKKRQKLKRILIRSCLIYDAYKKLFSKVKPDLIISVEKGFPDCCEVFYYAINNNIDYIQWTGCHEPESIMLKRYNKNNYRNHPGSISPYTWIHAKKNKFNEQLKEAVINEFKTGYTNNKWFKYKKLTDNTNIFTKNDIIKRLNLDPNKKISVIFSHILNDANLFYGDDLFQNGFTEWLIETIRAVKENNKVNWILKLHPANIYRRANLGYSGEYGEIIAIKDEFGEIPKCLKIIYPEDNINPLSAFECLDYAITVRGTIGAEIPCFGKVVLTAGTGRYSGLGFTNDSNTIDEYLYKIKNIQNISPLTDQEIELAIKHAYIFFNVRPAKYNTFANDIYKYPQGHPFNRDIKFRGKSYKELLKDIQLNRIIDWMINSKSEDFLSEDNNFKI